MKTEIEEILKTLIGKRLTRSTRALNMECLQFGELKQIEGGQIGEIAVHILCDWRIVGDKLYVGSRDINFMKSGAYDKNVDWDFETYRDFQIQGLLSNKVLVVDKITADSFGGFQLYFQNDLKLQVMPMSSSRDRVNEYWRIFRPGNSEEEHFVITSRGVQ